MHTPIHHFLCQYADQQPIRLHMPGIKTCPHDITEINGADSLYQSSGIIAESEQIATELFQTGATIYSTCGATLAIQAMLAMASAITGKTEVVAGRYSHSALIHSAVLLGLSVKWVYPDSMLSACLAPEAIAGQITPDTAAVWINSIDYYGGQSDVAAIAAICRQNGVLLLVDNAHGAYRVFTENHPMRLGADLCADSAHKTLPALTGAAYLHMRDTGWRAIAKSAMALFGTTSPSYLILESLDLCNRWIAENRVQAKQVMQEISEIKACWRNAGLCLLDSDPLRITLYAPQNGTAVARLLEAQNIFCEMADEEHVVLLFSAAMDLDTLAVVKNRMLQIYEHNQSLFSALPSARNAPCWTPPKAVLSPRAAYYAKQKAVPLTKVKELPLCDRIVGSVSMPCPPGVPLIMPGELLDDGGVALLHAFGVAEISLVQHYA